MSAVSPSEFLAFTQTPARSAKSTSSIRHRLNATCSKVSSFRKSSNGLAPNTRRISKNIANIFGAARRRGVSRQCGIFVAQPARSSAKRISSVPYINCVVQSCVAASVLCIHIDLFFDQREHSIGVLTKGCIHQRRITNIILYIKVRFRDYAILAFGILQDFRQAERTIPPSSQAKWIGVFP